MATRTDWFFLLGINFCDFQKVLSTRSSSFEGLLSVPSIDNIFVFVKYVQYKYILQYYGMRTLCKTSNSLYAVLSLNEGGKLSLNRHDFLVLDFSVANLSQPNIYFLREKCVR